jgi:hypothetical protein
MATEIRDSINPTGHLEITKIYKNGRHEVVYSKHNIITVGMGITLSELFGAAVDGDPAVNSLESYKIKYFQIGTGAIVDPATSSLTSLKTACTLGQYGAQTNLVVVHHNLWQNGSVSQAAFATINDAYMTKSGNSGVSFKFDLNQDTANGVAIDEIGLFSSDPFRRMWSTDQVRSSVLCAYRKFPEITKSSDFSLSFKWTITF